MMEAFIWVPTPCTLFLLLRVRTVTNGFSLLVGANSAIRNHSVPLNESSSGLMGVEAGVSFLYSHASDIFLPQVEFKLEISSDSTCHLWSLDPVKIHKSVLLKNITRGIHLLLRDLTLTYP